MKPAVRGPPDDLGFIQVICWASPFSRGGREELSGDKHEAGRADSAGSLSFDEDRALIKVRQPC